MAHPNVEQVREALTGVKYPGFSRDVVSFGLIRDVQVSEVAAVREHDEAIVEGPLQPPEAPLAQDEVVGVGEHAHPRVVAEGLALAGQVRPLEQHLGSHGFATLGEEERQGQLIEVAAEAALVDGSILGS